MNDRPRVGFVGVGNMGWPMAANLVRAGYDVSVADARRARADDFVQQVGGSAPETLRALGEACEIVVTILPTSAIVAEVLTGEDAVLDTLAPGSVVIEMTSGLPALTRRLAERVAACGSALIDAPVSGGVARARTGELAIMVGGEDAAVERVRPLLDAMGRTILRTGGVGSGQAMKALNNLVSAGGFLIGVEALLIGARFGLDPGMMVDVLNASTGMNNSTQKKFRQFVLSRKFDSGFGLDLMVKDLSIALDVGRDTATPAPFAALCREMWAAAAALLGPGQDHTALARLSEKLAGSELRG
ncbi:MAG: NAD(P)-dependent oxidoreductase [Acidisphaera sp.]|nr:NAD(P)-dependent oxidoreductase [Acidisphaera sp.]